ncbi:MAG: AI-2E family transporter [Cytophagaceae bacterium]|nr:AI-2E family transporter [Cytophagaceae bacterium]
MPFPEKSPNELRLPPVARLALVLLSTFLIVYGLYVLKEIITLLAFSLLLALLLLPLSQRLERWRVPRVGAIFVCLILLIAVLSGMVWLISMQLGNFASEFPKFEQKMTGILNRAQVMAEEQLGIKRSQQISELRKYSQNLLQNSGSYFTGLLSTTTNLVANLSLIPLFVFFILLYRDFFRQFIYKFFNDSRRSRIDEILRKIYTVVQGYLVGLIVVIGIVAALNTVGLVVLGIDYAPFFGILAAVLLLIPYIGILVGSILPILYALVTKDSPMYAVGVAGVFGLVQVLEGNFITPYVVGSKVSVNPLAAIIAFFVAGQLWGISGLVLALPITAILKVIFDNVEGLKAFGFLLGEPEETRPKENVAVRTVRQQMKKLKREVKETVEE